MGSSIIFLLQGQHLQQSFLLEILLAKLNFWFFQSTSNHVGLTIGEYLGQATSELSLVESLVNMLAESLVYILAESLVYMLAESLVCIKYGFSLSAHCKLYYC